MRYIGLGLALTTSHKAVVMDERARSLTPVLNVGTSAKSMEQLFQHAREGATPDKPLVVVMEPTGMAWFPIAVYCQRHGVEVFLVNSQQVADLRRYYRKHAKSDRIHARVLAKLPVVSPEKLHPLHLTHALLCWLQTASVRVSVAFDRLSRTSIIVAQTLENRERDDLSFSLCLRS